MAMDWTRTDVAQGLVPKQRESIEWAKRFMAGQIPITRLTAQQARDLMGLAGWLQQTYPYEDWSRVYQTYIEPALSGRVPGTLRGAALDYLTELALQSGQIPGPLLSFLQRSGPMALPEIQKQSDILTALAEAELYNLPEWQQAFQTFLARTAPGGTVRGGAPMWQAVAAPYYTLQQIAPEVAQQYGAPTFPTSAAGMSAYARGVLENIARAGLGAQGVAVGPQGFVQETPYQRFERERRPFKDVVMQWIQGALGVGEGAPPVSVPSAYPRGYTEPALKEVVEKQPAGAPPAKGSVPRRDQQQIVDNWKQTAPYRYASAAQALQDLDKADLKGQLDQDLIDELYRFVRTNRQWGLQYGR